MEGNLPFISESLRCSWSAVPNNFELASRQFIDLCGEGEWFVGTRGGSGDHAAIKLSRRGAIAHAKFYPFDVESSVPFPEGAPTSQSIFEEETGIKLDIVGIYPNYATAYEWSLKLKELAYVVAEPYSSADFQHGPVAMLQRDFPVLAIAPDGAVFDDMLLEFHRHLRKGIPHPV